jgi:hypothetical protein
MSKADELRALADRCEREEATVKLRHDIAKALGWTWVQFGYVQWRNPSGRDASVPNWCESLDAAVTLVPEEGVAWWEINMEPGVDTAGARAEVVFDRDQDGEHKGYARTPALALCAAALRARAAVSHPDPGAMRSERSERATSNPNIRTP